MDSESGCGAERRGVPEWYGARAPGARAGAAGRAGAGARAEDEAAAYAAGCGQAAVFAGQGDEKRAEMEGSTGAGRSTGEYDPGATGGADGAGRAGLGWWG